MTGSERMRLTRARHRRGERLIRLIVTEPQIDERGRTLYFC
jgi:hypothetical protein